MTNPAGTVDNLFPHLCIMLTLTLLRSFRFTIEIFTHSMKKKMTSFPSQPRYTMLVPYRNHRTKVQLLITRFFSALSFVCVIVVCSIVAAHPFIHIISPVLIVYPYGIPSY